MRPLRRDPVGIALVALSIGCVLVLCFMVAM